MACLVMYDGGVFGPVDELPAALVAASLAHHPHHPHHPHPRTAALTSSVIDRLGSTVPQRGVTDQCRLAW